MTREDAAGRLRYITEANNPKDPNVMAIAMGLEALERHRPKRPENRCGIQIFGPVKTFMGNCAVCGYPVNSNENYCYFCGQAIDWSEDEE